MLTRARLHGINIITSNNSKMSVIIYFRSLHREWLPILLGQGLMIKVLDNRKYKTNNDI